MKYQYVVILKKTGQRATDALSIGLCFLTALVVIYRAIGGGNFAAVPFAIAGLLLAGLILIIWRGRRLRPEKVRFRYPLFLAAVAWFYLTSAPWIGLFFLLLAFLEHQAKRPLEIGFDRDRIVINTLFRQRFDWGAFNNIILKDGLLTLDFKNNRLIQREVTDDDEDDDADEEEFNAYCRTRLAAADIYS